MSTRRKGRELLGQEWVRRVTNSNAPDLPVLGAGDFARGEWLRRYTARFIAVGALELEQAVALAHAETFEVLSDGFEDDPEGAADMEMSYWDGD